MKLKAFFALIAAKNEKATDELRSQYQQIIIDPDGDAVLRQGTKTEVVTYLESRSVKLTEDQYRRIRALSLLQLSQEEINLSLEASKGDENEQADKIKLFRSNIPPCS